MQKTEYEFYQKLKNQRTISKSNVAQSILNSKSLQSLLGAKVIEKIKSGRGYNYIINKQDHFEVFMTERFPAGDIEVLTEMDNQRKYRDTKATSVEKERVIFLRGNGSIIINDEAVDLSYYTLHFGMFSAVFKSLKAQKICFVENLQPFLHAEKLLGDEYVYIHFYGRFPKNDILSQIECIEYLHFGDYDFVGLHEYLRAKAVFNNAKIFIPENFEKFFKEYSKERKDKDTQYKNVKISNDSDIIRIRELILKTNRFLEQQILMENIYD